LEGPLYFLGAPSARQREFDIPADHIPVVIIDQDTSRDEGVTINMAMGIGMGQVFGRIRGAAAAARKSRAPGLIILTRKYNVPFLSTMTMLGLFPNQPQVALKDRTSQTDLMTRTLAPDVPTLILADKDAEQVLRLLGLDVDAAFKGQGEKTVSKESMRLKFQTQLVDTVAPNVVAVLQGTDPKWRHEAIVFSAHNDHVGMGPGGVVFNGADDNGSGTASLLELAQAFSSLKANERPKRSVVFLSVSGEELGLWGSEAWAEKADWPIKNIVANINIDMIGRSTDKVP
jgi:Zn-dependent M28 family amino/carboxypeptidase